MTIEGQITIDGIIEGIGSPWGEGAEYRYNPEGPSHLDDEDKERLRHDLEKLLAQHEQHIREEQFSRRELESIYQCANFVLYKETNYELKDMAVGISQKVVELLSQPNNKQQELK